MRSYLNFKKITLVLVKEGLAGNEITELQGQKHMVHDLVRYVYHRDPNLLVRQCSKKDQFSKSSKQKTVML